MTDISILRKRLEENEKIITTEWLEGLDKRKRKELEFSDVNHDITQRDSLDKNTYEKLRGNTKYYKGVGLSHAYTSNWIRENVKNKVFLDYACGNGSNAIKAAKYGATLAIGLDISSVSVENAKREAKKQTVDKNTRFIQVDAENTMLPDNSIDAIICSGVLHHLDLSYAFPELRRILRPGGKILADEALNYNPAIKLYRYLTPQMRTDWEKAHILSLRDIRFAKRFFEIGEIRYWHIASILAPYMMFALPALNWIDKFLTRIPVVKLMAWIFTFELIKPKEEN